MLVEKQDPKRCEQCDCDRVKAIGNVVEGNAPDTEGGGWESRTF